MRRKIFPDTEEALNEIRALVGIDDTYRFFLTSGEAEARAHISHQQGEVSSLTLADGLTGVIHSIEGQEHLDITHALGKLYLSELKNEYISFEIDGIGALFVHEKIPFEPLFETNRPKHLVQLRDGVRVLFDQFETINLEIVRLRNLLEESVPAARLPFADAERLPHIAVMAFDGLSSEALLFYLNAHDIEGALVTPDTVSFTLEADTTQEEIESVASRISQGVEMLQNASRGLK